MLPRKEESPLPAISKVRRAIAQRANSTASSVRFMRGSSRMAGGENLLTRQRATTKSVVALKPLRSRLKGVYDFLEVARQAAADGGDDDDGYDRDESHKQTVLDHALAFLITRDQRASPLDSGHVCVDCPVTKHPVNLR